MPEEVAYWLAVQSAPSMGAATLRLLLKTYGDLRSAVGARDEELLRRLRLRRDTVAGLVKARREMAEHQKLARLLQRQSIVLLTRTSQNYPTRFLDLTNPPEALYCQGSLPSREERTIAMVGTTEPCLEAQRLASDWAFALARDGFWVVSGFARGIDSAAHLGCLRAGGRTVAILPCGLLRFRGRTGLERRETLATCGAVVSEFHPLENWSVANAMARNRLIGALGDVIIVAQTKGQGGSLRTAEVARFLGKRVYVVRWQHTTSGSLNPFLKIGAEIIAPSVSLELLLDP